MYATEKDMNENMKIENNQPDVTIITNINMSDILKN